MNATKTGLSERSVRATARLAAALNILSAIPDGFSVNILQKLAVRNDAAATAANILHSEGLFRLGFVADFLAIVIFVASEVLLYTILKPAGKRSALFLLVLVLIGSAIQAMADAQDLAALILLKGGAGLSALPQAHAQSLALLFLRLHSYDYVVALFFFGCSSLVTASLVLRSTFVPRALGPLMTIDGLGFLTFSLGTLLSLPFAAHLYPYVPFATAAIGEGIFFLWLLIRSVNAERWLEQAAA